MTHQTCLAAPDWTHQVQRKCIALWATDHTLCSS